MKYGVEVTVKQIAYVEVEADCESEAKAKAEEMLGEDRLFFHESEITEAKVTGYF